MNTRIQFKDVETGVSRLKSRVDSFVPEMSLPIKDILQQFAYVDNVRLVDMAKRGFEFANDNEKDFDIAEFDTLDLAERDELYRQSRAIIDRYEEMKRQEAAVLEEKPVTDPDDGEA